MTLLDAVDRARIADDLGATLFVEAGAGTGKTTALVERIVSLVLDGRLKGDISDVAAITFTENAAAELRNRVRLQLERTAAVPASPQRRDPCLAALARLDDASLSTLHGFALRLRSDSPLEADLPVGFTVQDDVTAGLERDRWWERSVDAALDDAALSSVWATCLALGLAPGNLRRIADRLHADWDQLEDMPTTVRQIPVWDMAAVLTPLRQAVEAYTGAGPDGDPLTAYLHTSLPALLADLDAEDDDLGRATVLCDHKTAASKGNAAAWTKVGTPKSGPSDLLKAAKGAWEGQVTAVRTACLEHLVVWLRQVVLADAARRRRDGTLHFHDLLVLARGLLRQPHVRTQLHERWPVLMVDEFQDTDPLQVEIVHLLASTAPATSWQAATPGDGRLFFVGDPKQSIYRFRRADVELYEAVQHTVPPAQRPRLVQNFRSRPGILHVVNNALHELMDGKPGQVPYVALSAEREDVDDDPGPDVLLLGGPHGTDMAGVRAAEATHVASVCRQAVETWTVGDGQLVRYRDITVLVPTRTSLSELERALQAADVPYRVERRSLVWETDIVRELLAILEAVADPTDAVAVVAALRSAAFGCSDDDLVAWRAAGGRWDYRADPVEQSPVAAAMAALKRYHGRRWWVPVNQIVDELVRERRMVELTMGLPRPRDHWRRLRFVTDQSRAFLDGGGSGLGGFVRWARQQAERGADAVETVIAEPDDDAVRILTIHSSKGMEFPVTVLSGMNVDESLRVDTLWAGGRAEVTAKGFATSGWEAAKAKERAQFDAEAVRLLYVAATRAQDHLVVSLHHKAPKKNAGRNHAARLHLQVEQLTGLGAVAQLEAVDVPAVAQVPVERPDLDLDERSAAVEARAQLLARSRRSIPVSASGLPGEQDGEPADELTAAADAAEHADQPVRRLPPGAGGATLGSAVHRELELVDFGADDDELHGVADAVVAELGAHHLLTEVCRRVRVALDSDLLRSAQGRMWKEVPVSAPVGERFVEGYIDLVVETTDDAGTGLLVIDYKTDSVATEEELNEKARHYAPQLRAYAHVLAAATGLPVTGAALLFIGPTSSTRRDVPLEVSNPSG